MPACSRTSAFKRLYDDQEPPNEMIDLFLTKTLAGLLGFDCAPAHENLAVQMAAEPALVAGYGHFYPEQLVSHDTDQQCCTGHGRRLTVD